METYQTSSRFRALIALLGLVVAGTSAPSTRAQVTRDSSASASAPSLSRIDASNEPVLARRQQALDLLLKVVPPTATEFTGRLTAVDKTWEAWVQRTGELPPDFDLMPSIPELPDPLISVENGRRTPVTTVDQWRRQREWIKAQLQHWMIGRMPPAPDNMRATITATRREGDVRVEDVLLEFGPEHRGTLHLQILIPPGTGPFPVFLTDHPRRRQWVNSAIRRGYAGCLYQALDPYYKVPDDSDAWIDLYPDYDFSMLARFAWGAMRAVDYLETRSDIDKARIGLTGHSRNSKQALIAAAFDERIAAVVPSRGNSGDGEPWRFTTDVYQSESIEWLTGGMPNWYHPRLRFFVGREQKLPVDTNSMMALVAPRALLLSHAFTEHQGNALGIEQAYRSVRRVYRLLGREENLGLYQQPGEHSASAEDIDRYLDFFDTVFGRKSFPRPEMWVHGYDFERWRQLSGEHIEASAYSERAVGDKLGDRNGSPVENAAQWQQRRQGIQERVRWALGDEPPALPYLGRDRKNLRERTLGSEGWRGMLFRRPADGLTAAAIGFGDNLKAELYVPTGATLDPKPGEKWPVVIWLHPYSYATGYSRYSYWAPLLRRGFAVLAFDQIGFGSRNESTLRFYERYPHWSLLGKMVSDTRAAIDALELLDVIDRSRIYAFGYALGGKVGLWTAALDDRLAGVATMAGFAPLRLATADKGTEGIWHYSHLHGLAPRFGFFIGHERRLPIDYDEILAAIAPRPVYVIAPTLDRYNPVGDVRQAVEAARGPYRLLGHERALEIEQPVDFNRFTAETQKSAFDWLAAQAKLAASSEPSQHP